MQRPRPKRSQPSVPPQDLVAGGTNSAGNRECRACTLVDVRRGVLYLWARPSEACPKGGGKGRVGQRKRHRRTLGNRSASRCAGDRAPPRRGSGRDPQPGHGAHPPGRLSLQLAAPTAGEDHRVPACHGKTGAPPEDSSSAAGFSGIDPADTRAVPGSRGLDRHWSFRPRAPVTGRRESARDAVGP
jgi:hypothetical protein